jgi:8-oxo-dGTP pyrophosphatase MutT (NUDIX family)
MLLNKLSDINLLMSYTLECGVLVPLRVAGGRLETMMGRRNFFNPYNGRPMSFPGEWAFFGGGKKPEIDRDLRDTAVRELREELGYTNDLVGLFQLRGPVEQSFGIHYIMDFYASWFGSDVHVPLRGDGEVLVNGWMRPSAWSALSTSRSFDRQQSEDFARRELVDASGNPLERQMPTQQILTLDYLAQHEPELIARYNALEEKPASRIISPLFRAPGFHVRP